MKETKFNETDNGQLPEDWKNISLSDIFDFGNGYTPSKHNSTFWSNGIIPWFRIEDIREKGHILSDSLQHITSLAVKGDLFPKNSFIISTSATIGEYAYVTKPYLANQRFVCLIKKDKEKSRINDRYFLCICDSLGQWCRDNCDQGSSFASVNMSLFRAHKVALPPINEQCRIAKALSDVDSLLTTLDKLIEKKRNIKTATMQQLLTSKTRLKGFYEPWEEIKIEDAFVIISNNCLSRDKLSQTGIIQNIHYGDILVKYGAIINVITDELPYILSRYNTKNPLHNGDIILADTAEDATCGKACEIQGITNQLIEAGLHTIALRPQKIFGKNFLGYYVNSEAFHNSLLPLMQGTKVTSISKSAIIQAIMRVPSNKREQSAIANILLAMDLEIQALEKKRAKYEAIKKGMMQQLLTGKIRLI